MGLFGFLARRNPDLDLADTLRKIESRVTDLEALQVSREIEWRETKDKLLRYLKRVGELERRAGGGESGARRALLHAKFPQHREG